MTRQYWANLALCIVLGALVLFSVTRIGSALTPKGLFVHEPEISAETAALLQDVILVDCRMIEDAKNHVYEAAEFIIQNHTQRDVKNIKVLCDFEDADNRPVDRKVWYLGQTIAAQKQSTLKSVAQTFVNTTASLAKCSIMDVQPVREPFYTLERHVGEGHAGAEAEHGAEPAQGH